jgi:hypothetical protein
VGKLHSLYFADGQLVIAQDDEDLEHMTTELQEEYEAWSLTLYLTKINYQSGNLDTNSASKEMIQKIMRQL